MNLNKNPNANLEMTGPHKSKLKREGKELFEVLSTLTEKQLQVIVKYLDSCAVGHIGSLVYNLTQFENPNLSKKDKKKLYNCLIGNTKLATYLIKPKNSFAIKKKKIDTKRWLSSDITSSGLAPFGKHCSKSDLIICNVFFYKRTYFNGG